MSETLNSSRSALARALRAQARAGTLTGHTAGLAPDLVQGNLMILPAEHAADFLLFCQRNPKPCPVLGVSAPGEVAFPSLGVDIDIRTDVPQYRVWRDGQLAEECADVRHVWRDDLVSFVIGCSFSFEQALLDAGATVLPNSCGACAGYGATFPEAATVISTTARNFKGRMGPASVNVYLASPYTVAASALRGRISDAREVLA